MTIAFGVFLLILGVAILVWGDRKLNVREGMILKLASKPASHVKILKWAMAFAAFYCGIGLILGWWR